MPDNATPHAGHYGVAVGAGAGTGLAGTGSALPVGAAAGFAGAGGGTVKPGMYTDFIPKRGSAELMDWATPQQRGRLITSQ